jgi:hypothetical protein
MPQPRRPQRFVRARDRRCDGCAFRCIAVPSCVGHNRYSGICVTADGPRSTVLESVECHIALGTAPHCAALYGCASGVVYCTLHVASQVVCCNLHVILNGACCMRTLHAACCVVHAARCALHTVALHGLPALSSRGRSLLRRRASGRTGSAGGAAHAAPTAPPSESL